MENMYDVQCTRYNGFLEEVMGNKKLKLCSTSLHFVAIGIGD